MLPRRGLKAPDGHSVASPPLHQLPLGHVSQVREPLEEKVPLGQAVQEEVATALKVPAGQGVQEGEPEEVSKKVPPLQEEDPEV